MSDQPQKERTPHTRLITWIKLAKGMVDIFNKRNLTNVRDVLLVQYLARSAENAEACAMLSEAHL